MRTLVEYCISKGFVPPSVPNPRPSTPLLWFNGQVTPIADASSGLEQELYYKAAYEQQVVQQKVWNGEMDEDEDVLPQLLESLTVVRDQTIL